MPVAQIHLKDLVFSVTKSVFKTSSLSLEFCVLTQIAFCSFSYFTSTSSMWTRPFSIRYFNAQISSHMHNRWISSQINFILLIFNFFSSSRSLESNSAILFQAKFQSNVNYVLMHKAKMLEPIAQNQETSPVLSTGSLTSIPPSLPASLSWLFCVSCVQYNMYISLPEYFRL